MLHRTLSAALLGGVLLAASSCRTGTVTPESHWSVESVFPRVVKHFTGYRADIDGNYRDFQWRKKKDINLTLRRHFLNNNPYNPSQPFDPGLTELRGPHSLLPDAADYMHVESLIFGFAFTGISGAFIPIPVDSLIGTVTPGGPSEFGEGVVDTFTGDWTGKLPDPPPPGKFEVHNR